MDKLNKLGFIAIIPAVIGFSLIIAGAIKVNEQMIKAGVLVFFMGLVVTILLIVIVACILAAKGKLSDNGADSNNLALGEEDRDFKKIENVDASSLDHDNQTLDHESQMMQVDNVIRQTNNAHKYSSPKDLAIGGVVFGLVVVDFALVVVFAIKKSLIGFALCICFFIGIVLAIIITAKVKERRSMRAVDISKYQILCGVVKACIVNSMVSIGIGKSVTFRILIDSDGETYTAYSSKIYKVGAPVTFAVIKKNNARIVDSDKGINETGEVLSTGEEKDSL